MKVKHNGKECDVPQWALEQAYKNGYAKGCADAKAEIERLNKEVDRLSQCVLYHGGHIAYAIKDFADRLIEEKSYSHPYELNTRIVYVSDIQEMVGDGND